MLELRIGHIRCEHGLGQLHGLCSRQLLDRNRGRGIVDLHELPVRNVFVEQRHDVVHIVRWRDLHSRRGSELHGLQRGLIPVTARIVRLCGVRCRDILDIDERRNVIGVHGLRCRPVCLQHRGHVMLVMFGRQLLSRRGEQLHELCRRHLPIGHKGIELCGMSGEYILDRRRGLELDHVHSLPFGLSASKHRGYGLFVMPCRAIWLNWNMFELCCGYLSVQLKRTELRELWKRELSTNDWLNELHELCDRHVLGCGLDKLHKLRSRHLPISSGGVELFELPDGNVLSDNRCAVVKHLYRLCGRPVLVGHGGFGVNDLFRLRYRDVQCKYRLCVVFELHRRNILVVAIDRLHELRGRDVPNACRFEQLRRLRRRCLLHRDRGRCVKHMCELRGGTVRCSLRLIIMFVVHTR